MTTLPRATWRKLNELGYSPGKRPPAHISGGKWIVVETVLDDEKYFSTKFFFGNDYEDGTFNRVLRSLLDIYKSIPKEYRANARCGISSMNSYEDSHRATIRVEYTRPATDAEIQAAKDYDEMMARHTEEQERAKLAELQAKYGKEFSHGQ